MPTKRELLAGVGAGALLAGLCPPQAVAQAPAFKPGGDSAGPDPLAQRLCLAAQLGCHRLDRRPRQGMLTLVLQDQPSAALLELRRIPVLCTHCSIH
jgi:hypothetical protein